MSSALTNQVILITGASTGIGAALAHLLAQRFQNLRLVLAARNADRLDKVAAACRQAGAEVLTVPTDMAQLEQVTALADKAFDQFGRVDILINNAGYGQMGPVELIPLEACQRQFQVNVLGALALIQKVVPGMRDRGQGRIINVSSLAGRVAFPFGGLYSASKFALESLSDSLRMELEPFNIQVSVIEPGPVSTDFFASVAREVEAVIPDPATTPYRAAFAKLEGLEQQTSRNAWTAERVAEVIIQALTAPQAQPRYVAATGGDILLFAMRKVMPTWMVDKFWQSFYGIDRVAAEWKLKQKS